MTKIQYLTRYADLQLKEMLTDFPAISVDGARGVGKTSTAKQVAKSSYLLDKESDFTSFQASPELAMASPAPLLFDEWQRDPQIWDMVRRAVDDGAENGSYILTGSARPTPGTTVHTGAGRIIHLLMRPMSVEERQVESPVVSLSQLMKHGTEKLASGVLGKTTINAADYAEMIITSGLPGIYDRSPKAAQRLLNSYIGDLLQDDLKQAGYEIRSPQSLKQWLRSYASFVGTTANYGEILDRATVGDADKLSRSATEKYREVLHRLWLLDPLQPFALPGGIFKSLKKTPVHHLVDPGLAACLLRLDIDQLLMPKNGSVLGRLFESLVVQSVRSAAESLDWETTYMRDQKGTHEIDIVLEESPYARIAIEVKLSTSVSDDDVKHLLWFREKTMEDGEPTLKAAVVVYTGEIAYVRNDGVVVVPLSLLGR